MLKKTLIILSFLFGFLFSLHFSVHAAVTPTPTASYSMACMKVISKFDPECKPGTDQNCLARPANFEPSHNVRISGSGFTRGQQVYIIGCVQTANNFECTTGKNESVLGFQSKVISGYDFKVYEGNPITATDTTLTVNVHSQTQVGASHAFYAIYQTGGTTTSGGASSIKYGTPQFNQDASKCTTIHWDPKGRVFDSKTLEPIPNVTVKLLSGTSPSQLANIVGVNPVANTPATGAFSFYVPNGTYFLEPSLTGYQYPVNLTEVQGNYKKTYYCDKDQKNNYPIYNQQYPIVEENRLIHCDVPLKPQGAGYRGTVTTISFGDSAVPRSTVTKYEGQVSHPFTKIVFRGATTGIVIGKGVQADQFGFWENFIDNSKVPLVAPGVPDQVMVTYEKVDLTSSVTVTYSHVMEHIVSLVHSLFRFDVQAQNTNTQSITFDPILRYVEGYAYDPRGVAIPNATVQVRLKMSDAVAYETVADQTGFFSISSQNLPIFDYYFQIVGANNAPIIYTTTQFIQKNKTYLAQNKINLLTATKDGKSVDGSVAEDLNPSPTKSAAFLGQQFGSQSPTNPPPPSDAQASQADIILIILIIVILLAAVGGGIFFYLKKKQHQMPPFEG